MDDSKPIEFMRIDKKEIEISPRQTETFEKTGYPGSIKAQGETFDELAKNVKGFSKNSYLVEDERKILIQKQHNLRLVYLLLVEAGGPVMVGYFKNKINLNSKSARYSIFHKLREMGLIKTISVMNVFMIGSPHLKKDDFDEDDLEKFTEKERELVREEFRKWTDGMKTNKQKQTYRSTSFYWTLDKKGKDPEFLKFAINIENKYKRKEKEVEKNDE